MVHSWPTCNFYKVDMVMLKIVYWSKTFTLKNVIRYDEANVHSYLFFVCFSERKYLVTCIYI